MLVFVAPTVYTAVDNVVRDDFIAGRSDALYPVATIAIIHLRRTYYTNSVTALKFKGRMSATKVDFVNILTRQATIVFIVSGLSNRRRAWNLR